MRLIRYRRGQFPKKLVCSVCALLVVVGGFWQVEKNLKPTLWTLAEAKAKVIATQTINTVITRKATQAQGGNELVTIHRDNQGRVVLIQPNAMVFNKLAAETTNEVQEALKTISQQNIYIPLGQVLGSQIFANYGPKFVISILPVGTVDVKVIDKFEQAGINQTRHLIHLAVTTNMQVVIPLVSRVATIETQVPVAEYIVVGDVPSTYLQLPLSLSGVNE